MDKAVLPNIPMKKDDLESLQAEFLKKLKNDAPVYKIIQDLKMSNKDVHDNLGTLIDFQADYDYCLKCPGIEKCDKDTPNYSMEISFDGRFLDRRYNPCVRICEQMDLKARYLVRDFPDEWIGKKLADIDTTKQRNPLIIELINIVNGTSQNWVFLRGNINSGRTYILACFANQFAALGHTPIAFCDTSSLVERLKDESFNNKGRFAKDVEDLTAAALLVLDDFGNEYKSDFAFSTLLFPILNSRAKKGLVTMFTSDFTIDEIGSMYSEKVAPARGRQLANLLKARCPESFELNGINVYR